MGLDWLAGNKAKPGHEARFRELLEIIVAGKTELDEAETAEFMEIGVPAFTTLGAPQVGIDEPATAWFLARLREKKPRPGLLRSLFTKKGSAGPTPEEIAAIEQMRGYRVLELAPPCDGLPMYSNASINSELDLTSFRGAFLNDCEELLGKELLESAWGRKLPEDLVAYGHALMERADAWVAAHGCEWVRDQVTPPDDSASPAAQAHIVFAAARWCLYWGERGHWLDPWF